MSLLGRPTTYDEEKATKICELVAKGTFTHDAAKEAGVPPSTVYEWLWHNPDFSELYARARQTQAQIWAKKMMEVLAVPDDDDIVSAGGVDGKKMCNSARVMRARELAGKYQWLAAKADPYQYGDKLRIEEVQELEKRIAELEAKK